MTTEGISITRRVEFDAGHRIPDHSSQCRNIHGHRYILEVTVTGEVRNEPGNSENGMIVDFGALKEILTTEIVEQWDHALLLSKDDTAVINLVAAIHDHKTVLFDSAPTVEHLVQVVATKLSRYLSVRYRGAVTLVNVRLYETPNCWADAFQP